MSRVPARNPRNLRVGPWSIMFLLASQMNTGATFRSLTTGSADVSAKQHVTGICCRLKVVCYAPRIGTIDRLLTLRTPAVVVEVVVGFSLSVALPLPRAASPLRLASAPPSCRHPASSWREAWGSVQRNGRFDTLRSRQPWHRHSHVVRYLRNFEVAQRSRTELRNGLGQALLSAGMGIYCARPVELAEDGLQQIHDSLRVLRGQVVLTPQLRLHEATAVDVAGEVRLCPAEQGFRWNVAWLQDFGRCVGKRLTWTDNVRLDYPGYSYAHPHTYTQTHIYTLTYEFPLSLYTYTHML